MFREDLLSSSIVFRLYFQYAEGVPLHNDSTIPCASTALTHQGTLRTDGIFHQIHSAGRRRSCMVTEETSMEFQGRDKENSAYQRSEEQEEGQIWNSR